MRWFATLSRPARLALVTVAAVATAAVVLTVAGTFAGGASAAKTRALPLAKSFTVSVLGHPGEHISLSDYAGRPVILNFFASWCPPCQRETPLIARFYASAHGHATIVGIDVNDQPSNALAFVHKDGVTYPVGTDPAPMRTAISYGVNDMPQTFFLNAQHRIVERIFGAVTLRELQAGAALIKDGTK